MAKEPDSQMSAPAIRSGIDRKLHRLTGPTYLGILAPAKRLADAEARG